MMLRKTTALLTVTAAVTLVAGCGGNGNSGESTKAMEPPTDASATTPPGKGPVDSINWALSSGEPTTLDPVKTGDYSPNTVLMNVCEPLLRMNADYSTSPGLAESWTQTPTSIVYKLRPGVKFSNGKPMTADDVAGSLKRNMDPATDPINGDFFTSVKSIDATGPLEVTVTMNKPDILFAEGMSTEFGDIVDVADATAAGASYGTASHPPICTGPYKVASWNAGSSITLQARDDYWDTKLQPMVKTVNFKFLEDTSTLTSALLSGEIDGTYEAPSTSFDTLQKTDAGKLYLGPSTQVFNLSPANPETPMAKTELAQALDKAIDRAAIVKNVWHGAGTPNRAVIPPSSFGKGPGAAVFQKAYDALPDNSRPDIEGAKALVAKVGAPSKTMTLALPAGDQSQLQIATFVQASAKSIGLNFDLKQMPATEFSSLFYDASKRKDVDLVLSAGYVEVPDPLSYAILLFPKDALFNWTGFDNPQVDADIAKARQETDPAASARAYVDAQAIWEAQKQRVPIGTPYERLFMNKRITGAPASFAYINMPWAAMIGAS